MRAGMRNARGMRVPGFARRRLAMRALVAEHRWAVEHHTAMSRAQSAEVSSAPVEIRQPINPASWIRRPDGRGARCCALGTGYWVLGAGCWVLGAGCWGAGVPGAGCRLPSTKCWLPGAWLGVRGTSAGYECEVRVRSTNASQCYAGAWPPQCLRQSPRPSAPKLVAQNKKAPHVDAVLFLVLVGTRTSDLRMKNYAI